MCNHEIRAANNGFHWTIAFDEDGRILERNLKVRADLYTLFECTCGSSFDEKSNAVGHLHTIAGDESGEAVTVYQRTGVRYETTSSS